MHVLITAGAGRATEDQGWVAHFIIRTLRRWPLARDGGLQARAFLFVEDLVEALLPRRLVFGTQTHIDLWPPQSLARIDESTLLESGSDDPDEVVHHQHLAEQRDALLDRGVAAP